MADYNQNDFRGEEEKKEVKEVPGKKKIVTFDQNDMNDNKKVDKSEDEKSTEVTEQLMKNMEMLDLKSLDDL